MPLDLLDRLQRILVFADKVADEIVYEETEILDSMTAARRRPPCSSSKVSGRWLGPWHHPVFKHSVPLAESTGHPALYHDRVLKPA